MILGTSLSIDLISRLSAAFSMLSIISPWSVTTQVVSHFSCLLLDKDLRVVLGLYSVLAYPYDLGYYYGI